MMKQHGESESPCGELFVSLGGSEDILVNKCCSEGEEDEQIQMGPTHSNIFNTFNFFSVPSKPELISKPYFKTR